MFRFDSCTFGRRAIQLLALSLALVGADVCARGVSPYLPLNISPEIERQVERLLILADKPVMRRPIPAAVVLDALPKACERDRALCEEVKDYLRRYMDSYGITNAEIGLTLAKDDSNTTVPNQHGEPVDSKWQASASAYFQPSDYFLVNAGGIVYDGYATATNSFVSFGSSWAQLDVGFRDHWLSPLTDSSSLISTEAATMPSITLSNYEPIGLLGINYEIFMGKMSRQEGIVYLDSSTSGNPRLAGLQVGIEPVSGYSFAVNRIVQYGGGAHGGRGYSDFIDAMFSSSNGTGLPGAAQDTSNKVASITSSIIFPAKVPFAMHVEYAGEDNAYAVGYRLGAINMSVGIDFPKLFETFDAGYEISEWQNDWYVHSLYPDGLTNQGDVIGHWFGDNRAFGNAIGGRSQSLRVGWRLSSGDYLQATYRNLAYDPKWAGTVNDSQHVFHEHVPYRRLQILGLDYSIVWQGRKVTAQLLGGRDVFGSSFARVGGSIDFADNRLMRNGTSAPSIESNDGEGDGVDLFVDVGANRSSVLKFLVIGTPSPPILSTDSWHVAVGARRSVTRRGDLGTRIELDDVQGYRLLSLRALDYRYRFTRRFAVNGFFGYGRYDVGLPADGYYWGAGVQLLNILPKWDMGFDIRHYEKLSRDKALPTDPPASAAGHPRMYFDIDGMSLYLSKRW